MSEATLEQLMERYEDYSTDQNNLSGEKHMIALQIQRRFGISLPGEFSSEPDPRDTQIAALEQERDALRAKVERLTGVLKPFADTWSEYEEYCDAYITNQSDPYSLLDYMDRFYGRYSDKYMEQYEAAHEALEREE